MRTLLWLCLVLSVAGTAADLLLLGHYEDPWQWAPIVLLGMSLAVLVWRRISPSQVATTMVRITMVAMMGAAALGLWFHLQGNLEFEREVSPSLQGAALFWKAIRGASPPSLAPAALLQLGFLGLIYSFVQPADEPVRPTRAGETS